MTVLSFLLGLLLTLTVRMHEGFHVLEALGACARSAEILLIQNWLHGGLLCFPGRKIALQGRTGGHKPLYTHSAECSLQMTLNKAL